MDTQLTPARFEEILSSVPQTVIEIDAELRIRYINRPTGPFFTREPTVGAHVLDLVSSKAADAIADAVDNAQRIGRALTEYRVENAVYSVSAKPLQTGEGTLIIIESASQFDVGGGTVRQVLRDHSRFLSAIRYDLANPLSAVIGCAGVLLDRGASLKGETRSTLVRHMNDEAYNLSATLDDLKTAISLELGQLDIASVEFDTVASVLTVAEGLGPRANSIEIDHQGEVVAIGDPVRFGQIVRSLLLNSLSHGRGRVKVTIEKEDDRVRLAVRDKGELVSADLSRPGDQKPSGYPTTPRKVGLGLWVSKELAAAMGGDLRFDHLGTEVKFSLSLPC